MSEFIDLTAPSMQGGYPRDPETLPHGLISPPDAAREQLARLKAQFPPEASDAAAEERHLNQYTIDYYFNYLGHDVVYRQTPHGPEVLAVGFEEALALQRRVGLEEYQKYQIWTW
jgi:hypothetical protein